MIDSIKEALAGSTSLFVIFDGLINSFDILLGLSGELFGLIFLHDRIESIFQSGTAAELRWVLLFIAVLYVISRLDRFYRSYKNEVNDTT